MEQKFNREQISEYYDTFCEEEKSYRLKIRHYMIFRHLIRNGLRRSDRVLEVGCGFGTVTYLIAKYLKSGSILATDISKGRIEACKKKFQGLQKVSFTLTDMNNFHSDTLFDFIVLPDVIEHIPIESHDSLFGTLSDNLSQNGTILIHVPHPQAIAFLRKHHPDSLQIIDQEIHSDTLLNVAYKHGLIIESLRSYGLAHEQNDYQVIVFKKRQPYKDFTRVSQYTTIFHKLIARLLFILKTL